jgi:hypothetical protein
MDRDFAIASAAAAIAPARADLVPATDDEQAFRVMQPSLPQIARSRSQSSYALRMNWLRRFWPRKILLFCDYYADPIWTHRKRDSLRVDLLPLTDQTKEDLRAWAAKHDEGLEAIGDTDTPSGSTAAEVEREGLRLWRVVQGELGPTWKVGYLSERTGRILW